MTSTQLPWRRSSATALMVPVLLLGACGGGEDEKTTSPEDALATAKAKLDDTTGVSLSLTTGEVPEGVDALVKADGVGTHQPAFEGDIKVSVNSLEIEVPVVAVEGDVFAQLPFTSKFAPIEPDDYGAPNPAALMDTRAGLSSWLTALEGVEEGDQTRDGDKVLTTYTGTLPGSAVAEVIPSASTDADFEATFSIDDDGFLDTAEVAGPFYGDAGDVDYVITLDDYGTDKDISRP